MKKTRWLSVAVFMLFPRCINSDTSFKTVTSAASLHDSTWEKCWEEADIKVEIIDKKLKISTESVNYSLDKTGRKATFKNGAEIVLDENNTPNLNGTFQTKLAIRADIAAVKKDAKFTCLAVQCSRFENSGYLSAEVLYVFEEKSSKKDRHGFFNLGNLYSQNFFCDRLEILNKGRMRLANQLDAQSVIDDGIIIFEKNARLNVDTLKVLDLSAIYFWSEGKINAKNIHIVDRGDIKFEKSGIADARNLEILSCGLLMMKEGKISADNMNFLGIGGVVFEKKGRVDANHIKLGGNSSIITEETGEITAKDIKISEAGYAELSGGGNCTARNIKISDDGNITFKKNGAITTQDLTISNNGAVNFNNTGMITAVSTHVSNEGKIIFKGKGEVAAADVFLSENGKIIFEKDRYMNAVIHQK